MPDAVSSSPIRGKARDRRMRENCLSGGNGGLVPGDRAFYSLLIGLRGISENLAAILLIGFAHSELMNT